jgi:hypothetical protein
MRKTTKLNISVETMTEAMQQYIDKEMTGKYSVASVAIDATGSSSYDSPGFVVTIVEVETDASKVA